MSSIEVRHPGPPAPCRPVRRLPAAATAPPPTCHPEPAQPRSGEARRRIPRNVSPARAVVTSALILLALLLSPTAFAQQTPAESTASAEYKIGPKDLLSISVLEIPELNVERRVSENGTIDLPLVGDFAVTGLSTREVSDRLTTVLTDKYVNRANVTIIVKQYGNKPLSVVGAVANPGSLNVTGRYTLLQAVSAAGGLTQQAGKKIYIMRTSDNGLSDMLEVKTDDLFRSASAQWNIPIYPSDVVNVPARTVVKVFCMGEVKQPGALEFDSDDRITLLSVIAKAGGLTDRASNSIRIKHRGPDGKDVETVVNYKRILSGAEPDPTLTGDDVVIVKESFF
jgi:polysaccharide export outer membrane protein